MFLFAKNVSKRGLLWGEMFNKHAWQTRQSIHAAHIYDNKPSCLRTISQAHKPPKQHVFQQEELTLKVKA